MALTPEQIQQLVTNFKENNKEEWNKQVNAGAALNAAVFIMWLNNQVMALQLSAEDQKSFKSALGNDKEWGPVIQQAFVQVKESLEGKGQAKQAVDNQIKQIFADLAARITVINQEHNEKVTNILDKAGALKPANGSPEDIEQRNLQMSIQAGEGATVPTQAEAERQESMMTEVKEYLDGKKLKLEVPAEDHLTRTLMAVAMNRDLSPETLLVMLKDLADEEIKYGGKLRHESTKANHKLNEAQSTSTVQYDFENVLGRLTNLAPVGDKLREKQAEEEIARLGLGGQLGQPRANTAVPTPPTLGGRKS
jgi:hypothetical protein